MKRALVLGGAGFIGHHLVPELLAHGWEVVVYDRTAANPFEGDSGAVSYICGELGNRTLVRSAVRGVDAVFHLACTTIPKSSNDDPAYDVESNVCATVELLQECVRAEVGRFVFLSSGGTVYGLPGTSRLTEDHRTEPICSYGITKLTVERYLHLFHYLHGMRYAVLRPSNPYGEHQGKSGEQGAIAVFLGRIVRGLPVHVWGDGSVVRDYFYVGDLARASRLSAESEASSLVVNVGSGEGLSLQELFDCFREMLGLEFDVTYESGRVFDVPRLVLDPARARRLLGWKPRVSLEEGLRRTWSWIVAQRDERPEEDEQ